MGVEISKNEGSVGESIKEGQEGWRVTLCAAAGWGNVNISKGEGVIIGIDLDGEFFKVGVILEGEWTGYLLKWD